LAAFVQMDIECLSVRLTVCLSLSVLLPAMLAYVALIGE